MSDYFQREPTDKEKLTATIIGVVFLVIGYLLGGGIEGDQRWKAAMDWAVQTTRQCEISTRTEGRPDVTDCLKRAIAQGEEEQRAERQAEGYDPRR